jgi:hypothetical protein
LLQGATDVAMVEPAARDRQSMAGAQGCSPGGIGKQGLESTYGAAASIVVVLIWVYYSAQLVLMGAEFTSVYARRYGSRRGEAARERSEGKPADIRHARAA